MRAFRVGRPDDKIIVERAPMSPREARNEALNGIGPWGFRIDCEIREETPAEYRWWLLRIGLLWATIVGLPAAKILLYNTDWMR